MRNGDYTPNRLGAQYDAAAALINTKLINPESTVGLISYGSNSVRVLSSPTDDIGKLLSSMGEVRAEGEGNLIPTIKTAMLAMRHRKNKNGRMRIVLFVGSPIPGQVTSTLSTGTGKPSGGVTVKDFEQLGAALRKDSIGIDVIAVGESEGNAPYLEALVKGANKEGNPSRLLIVPEGILPSDAVRDSDIMRDDLPGGVGGNPPAGGAAGGAGGGGGTFGEYGGIDPSMDPELAMAMRASMEEDRARHAAAERAAVAESAASAGGPSGQAAGASMVTEDDPELLAALAMSMEGTDASAPAPATAASAAPAPAPAASSAAPTTPASASASEDTAMAGSPAPAASASAAGASGGGGVRFTDPDFIQSVLGTLDGIDINDPEIQAALAEAMGQGAGGQGQGGEGGSGGGSGTGSGSGSQ